MKYGSVCSGIEAASAAWHGLGWQPAFFSEIEVFPRAVLAHHYPTVPLHGDFTTIGADDYGAIDLLVGGTPCQSFSVAGLRGGLDDDRGNLALEFLRLADRKRPRWVVWENVPGVLSSNGGRDFGSILGGLGQLGYGWAYRVLDAQYFGVAQRRRRVFVVGYLGDWRRAAAVLFERHSLSGHPAPRREKGQRLADTLTVGANQCSGFIGDITEDKWPAEVAPTLNAAFGSKQGLEDQHVNAGCPLFVPDVVGTLRTRRPGEGGVQGDFDHIVPVVSPALNTQSGSHHAPDTKAYVAYAIMPMNSGKDYKARETEVAQPIMAAGPVGGNQGGDFIVTPFDTTQISSPHNYSNPQPGDPCHPLAAGAHAPTIIAFSFKDSGNDASDSISPTLRSLGAYGANGGSQMAVAFATQQTPKGWDMELGTCPTLQVPSKSGGGQPHAVAVASAVRRLTPRECERLQGFPDDFTAIPWRKKGAEDCPDGPRYKALGNSMAVPVMRWIGERIAAVEAFNAP